MTRQSRLRWLPPTVGTLMILSLAGPAAASSTTQHLSIDDTYFDAVTSEYCGFDVFVHEVAELTIKTTTNKSGSLFREVLSGPSTYTATAPSTGESVTALNTATLTLKVHDTPRRLTFVSKFVGLNYEVETEDGVFRSEGTSVEGIEIRYARDGSIGSAEVFGRAFSPSLEHLYPRLCVWLGADDTDGDFLPDNQGLRNEVVYGTDPLNPDTDGDGFLDGVEVGNEMDPTDPTSYPGKKVKDLDADDDFLSDGYELVHTFTDPRNPDTDGDGFLDGYEFFLFGTDPLDASSHP